MPLILGGSAAVTTGYSIDNSCRFNRADSEELHFTQGTPTDNNTWTYSCWFKRGSTTTEQATLGAWSDGSNQTKLRIMADATTQFIDYQGGSNTGKLTTDRLLRDPSAWMHMVVVWDSDNVTAGNRMRMYINGTEETSFSTDTNPSSGQATILNVSGRVMYVGRDYDGTYWDGHMADVIFIDGTAYAASDFGEFNEDSPTIWQPKDPSGLTFGNNGCWLDFEDSADLGNDVSGKGNDFTVSNLAAVDQSSDSPTNNFCTMNPLDNYWRASTFTFGNNTLTGSTSNKTFNTGTLAMTAGKWYWEALVVDANDPNYFWGIVASAPTSASDHLVDTTNSKYIYDGSNGKIAPPASAGSTITYGDSYTTGDYIAIYLDFDNSKIYFSKNGVIQNSGTGVTFTPSLSTSDGGLGQWTPVQGNGSSVNWGACSWNFGNGSFGSTAAGATNADANGYGVFKYSPNDGGSASFDGSAKDFLALCTKNLGSDGG